MKFGLMHERDTIDAMFILSMMQEVYHTRGEDTTGLPLGGGESGHPHLLGIIPDCCWVEVNQATLAC